MSHSTLTRKTLNRSTIKDENQNNTSIDKTTNATKHNSETMNKIGGNNVPDRPKNSTPSLKVHTTISKSHGKFSPKSKPSSPVVPNQTRRNGNFGSTLTSIGGNRGHSYSTMRRADSSTSFRSESLNDSTNESRDNFALLSPSEQQDIRDAFHFLDLKRDNKIDKEELQSVFKTVMGENLSISECMAIFEVVDEDRSGFIDFDEFIELMTGEVGRKAAEMGHHNFPNMPRT